MVAWLIVGALRGVLALLVVVASVILVVVRLH